MPESKILTSVHLGITLELWNTSGDILASVEKHDAKVNSVSISPDGKKIASASDDGIVLLWDNHGSLLGTIEHPESVNSVAFSTDGKILATASDDKVIRLFDQYGNSLLNNKGHELELKGHTDTVTSVLFSPDGKTLTSASTDDTIKLWSTENWRQIGREFKIRDVSNTQTDSLWFSNNSDILAYGDRPTYVRLTNIRIFQNIRTNNLNFFPVNEIPEYGLSDSKEWITVQGNKGTIILSLGLDYSLKQACEWVDDHLRTNDDKSDDNLCKGILDEKETE